MDAQTSLLELFQSQRLMDPRRAQGLRHPLPAILALTVLAMLTGIRSRAGVEQFGNAYGPRFLRLLGFRRRKAPSQSTLFRVFRDLDAAAFEAMLQDWMAARLGRRAYTQITVDGKSLRGTRGPNLPAVHLVAAFAPEVEATLVQLRVDQKTNEHKAALELLGVLPLTGKVVTADAMFTQRDVCTQIRQQGGDYVLPVKDNQPALRQAIQEEFEPPAAGLSPPTATTSGRPGADRDPGRQRARSSGTAHPAGHPGAERLSGLAGGRPGVSSAS